MWDSKQSKVFFMHWEFDNVTSGTEMIALNIFVCFFCDFCICIMIFQQKQFQKQLKIKHLADYSISSASKITCNNFDNPLITVGIFQINMPNIPWLELLSCRGLLLFSVLSDSRLNISLVGQQNVCFFTFYKPNKWLITWENNWQINYELIN